jgi:hypothetical protein
MGFTSTPFLLLELFPHLRLLTFCLASFARPCAWNLFGFESGPTQHPTRFELQSCLALALQLASLASEQLACRVTRKVLLFCVRWFSFDKAKKTQKTQKKRKKNAPTADIDVLWRINDTTLHI